MLHTFHLQKFEFFDLEFCKIMVEDKNSEVSFAFVILIATAAQECKLPS